MQWMVKLYDKALVWSQHKYAPHYLAAVSFVEASVFPIPPYFMLAPMALARPTKAFNYALIATVASVFGGLLGYLLGYLIFKPVVLPLIEYLGYVNVYQHVMTVFVKHGFLAILLLGVTPIPYKLVAIAAGFVIVPIPYFIMASFITRGMKFFALALLIKVGGVTMEQQMRLLVEKLGFYCLGFALMGLLIYWVI